MHNIYSWPDWRVGPADQGSVESKFLLVTPMERRAMTISGGYPLTRGHEYAYKPHMLYSKANALC